MAFHVNPNTGVPAVCTASSGRCPFGGDADHKDTAAEAMKAFESSFVSAVPAPQVKATPKATAALDQAAAAVKEARAKADAIPRTDLEARAQAFKNVRAKGAIYEQELKAIERKGLGHVVPDDGPTVRVATLAQKTLLEDHLKGQISDGQWENSGPDDHWKVWCDATVIVDPAHVGRNFHARKDNYQLNSSSLLSIVGDEMIASVKDEHNEASYDERKLRQDLSGLRKIFKTNRPDHKGSDAPAQEILLKSNGGKTSSMDTSNTVPLTGPNAGQPDLSAKGIPTAPTKRSGGTKSSYAMNVSDHTSKAMISAAMAGPGRAKAEQGLFGVHSGMANPTTGEGDDYDHIKDGGSLIVGKADGSRARVMAGGGEMYSDPGDELGRPVRLTKQRNTGPDAVTNGLYVLGYRDPKGNSYGYVPDKKIQYFVFK